MDFDPADQFRRLNRLSVEHRFKAITEILERNRERRRHSRRDGFVGNACRKWNMSRLI